MTETGEPKAPAPAALAPSRLLTFLLADIRGYTAYTATYGDEAAARLSERFLALCRQVAESFGGEEFGSAGDQALTAFPSAGQALRAAVTLQQRLTERQKQDADLPWRAGIGLDTGDAVRVGNDYRSAAINLAARLCSLADAGDIFASEGVIHNAHVTDRLVFVSRGEVRLKGLTDPVRVIQIGLEGTLPESLPPLQPILVTHPTNLPDEPTPFIGRQQEIREIVCLLQQPHVRMLTLTGPGGTGKTRLALQVGNQLLHKFQDGVFFVDLSPLTEPALVPAAIARGLGLSETGGADLVQNLGQHLAEKQILLVLDNYEHLLEASGVVVQLLDTSRTVHILVTSRVPLHVSREYEYAVPPLDTPDPRSLPDPDQLCQYEAVALFIERAAAVRPSFVVNRENAPAVVEICCRLDGLPLAIELAAARIKLFPPQALLQRLSHRLTVLTGGPRDRSSRQQTLRGAIDWSYSLLSADEQVLFARLSVFAGGCTFDAAEAVCAPDGELDTFEGLSSLMDKSLLRQEGEEEPRFSMLETIREYAGMKLNERAEEKVIRERHAAYFTSLAEQAEPELTGPEQVSWLRRLEREHDNLRAVLRWGCEHDCETGLRLAAALWRFWYVHGHLTEGRSWLEELLARTREQGGHGALRAKALSGAGTLAPVQGDYGRAAELFQESLELQRELGDTRGIATSIANLGFVALLKGDYGRSTELYEESLQLRRQLGDREEIAQSLNYLGSLAMYQGEHERATSLVNESLRLMRELGDRGGIAYALLNLGLLAHVQDDLGGARDGLEEALRLLEGLEDKRGMSYSLNYLGVVAERMGDCERAQELLERSLQIARDMCHRRGIAEALSNLAVVAMRRSQFARAAQLLGAADTIVEIIKAVRTPHDRKRLDEAAQQLRTALGEAAYEDARARGRTMTVEQAIAYARGV